MSTNSTNNILKFLTLALVLLLVSLGVYTFKFYNEVKDNEAQLVKEKELISEELEEEIGRYEAVLQNNNELSGRLEQSKGELIALQNKLKAQEITRAVVQEYQVELRKFRKEREILFRKNDSLVRETERLANLQRQTQEALDIANRQQDSLSNENTNLNSQVALAAKISVRNVVIRGVIQRNSGKFVPTIRAGRAEMIQVKYVVNANPLATAKDLPFYTQIKGPNGRIVGTRRSIAFDDGTVLEYSNKTVVPYKKEDHSISELVLPQSSLIKGDYTISIFHNEEQVVSGTLTLK